MRYFGRRISVLALAPLLVLAVSVVPPMRVGATAQDCWVRSYGTANRDGVMFGTADSNLGGFRAFGVLGAGTQVNPVDGDMWMLRTREDGVLAAADRYGSTAPGVADFAVAGTAVIPGSHLGVSAVFGGGRRLTYPGRTPDMYPSVVRIGPSSADFDEWIYRDYPVAYFGITAVKPVEDQLGRGYILGGWGGGNGHDAYVLRVDLQGEVVKGWGLDGGYTFQSQPTTTSLYDEVWDVRQVKIQVSADPPVSARIYLVAGWHNVPSGSPAFPPDEQLFVAAFDETGHLLWNRSYGAPNSRERAMWVDLAHDGTVVVAGSTSNPLGGALPGGLLMKLSLADGSAIWQRAVGTGYPNYLEHVHHLGSGGFVVGGFVETGPAGQNDEAWVAELDALGGVVWSQTFGGASDDMVRWIHPVNHVGPPEGFFAGGSTWSFGAGGADAWLVRLPANAGSNFPTARSGYGFAARSNANSTSSTPLVFTSSVPPLAGVNTLAKHREPGQSAPSIGSPIGQEMTRSSQAVTSHFIASC